MRISKDKPLILASSSPRRREILELLKIPFIPETARDFLEHPQDAFSAEELALENALGKAEDVAKRYPSGFVLGVDTLGILEGAILEKPKDQEDAKRMLSSMQGKIHTIYSGIVVIDTETGQKKTALEKTEVEFAPMTSQEIERYLEKEYVLDKSGSYAAQGLMSLFIRSFKGDFWNVVGLPMARINEIFKTFDINLLDIVE